MSLFIAIWSSLVGKVSSNEPLKGELLETTTGLVLTETSTGLSLLEE